MVYVVDKHNKPLMPTKRYAKVRILLKNKLAVPISNNPFTIKLKYKTTNYTQDLWLGVDVGRENIGFGVSKEDGECVFLSELKTNNKSIKKNMEQRKQFRQQRKRHQRIRKQRKAIRDNKTIQNGNDDILRTKKECKSKTIIYPGMEEGIVCKVIKGAEAQFNNRKREEGWLTPSARQLIQMHLLSIQKILSFLPISHIIIERNVFDFQKLENEDIRKWEYTKGPLYGYKDYKEYIYEQQNGICLLCGKKKIEHYHHIVPRSKKGSNTPSNIAGLCYECHNGVNGVHKNQESALKLSENKEGLKTKYSVSLLNTVMPFLIEDIKDLCIKENILFNLTTGLDTYQTRNKYSLPKRHSVDGYAISISDREMKECKLSNIVYIQQRFKKKSAANIVRLNSRKYYILDGKKEILVAKNRHKAEEQKEDSLQEYMGKYSKNHTKDECIKHLKSLIVKSAKREYLAHRDGKWGDIHTGDIVKYEKHNKVKGNIKQNIFVATSIDFTHTQIIGKLIAKQQKFCKKLSSGCIPFIEKEAI